MSAYGFIPLSRALPYWPSDLFGQPEFLDEVGVREFQVQEGENLLAMSGILVWLRELSLDISGLNGFSVAVLSGNGYTAAPFEVGVLPDFAVRLPSLSIAIRLTNDWLRPVRRENGIWVPVRNASGNLTPAELRLEAVGVQVDLDGDLDLLMPAGGPQIGMGPVQIGDTGLVLEIDGVVPYLSRKQPPPQDAPPGFRGVAIESVTLHLPSEWDIPLSPTSVEFDDLFIGTGGLSGTVRGNWNPLFDAASKRHSGDGAGTLFGIPLGLSSLEITFHQNVPNASAIHCEMVLPFFDQPVAVDMGLGVNGDFTAALSAVQPPGVTRTDGLIEFEKPGILRLRLDSLGFEKRGNDFLVKLSGTIKLLYGGIDWPEVEVRELSIDQHGHIQIEGGWLDLPQSKVLDFNGFTMELAKIGFGNAGDRKWIGFSGGIRLVDELALGASVEGLKILWDSAGNVDLQMSSVRVELTIPEVLDFDGFVEYFQDGDTKGFKGDIDLTLYPLDTSFDASLIVGRKTQAPSYNFFYIFIDAELPAGIPLAQTNLAIYGFSALMGNNVAPTRTPDQEWFGWYLLPPIGTTATQKWTDVRGAQSLGAGLTLGTASDDGFAFSLKALLIVLLPGPLLLIDGKANMLKARKELAGEAQGDYRALAVLDRRAGTFLVNIQPRYKWDPSQGAVIDVIGVAEGFFDFNRPEAWHLYLGEAEPHEKRIRAKIFKGLLRADSYLMLDQPGMRLGASAGFDEDYTFGPLSVALKAQIDGQAEVSWRPIQVDGVLTLEGQAKLRAFGCKSSASVNARLEVQTPKPYYIYGDFRVKLKTPWPLRDPSARVKLEWGDPDEEPCPEDTVGGVAAEHLKVTESWDFAIREQALPPPSVPGDVPIIPLDSKLLISFNRPVADRALVGCNAMSPPHAERVGQFEMLHELVGVELSRAQDSVWDSVEQRIDGEGVLYGMWLPLAAEEKAAGKLQLWSGSPFTYGRRSGRGYLDWFLDKHPNYPCTPAEPAEAFCFDFDEVKARLFPALFVVGDLIFEFLFSGKEMQPKLVTYESSWTGTKYALLLGDPNTESIEGRVPLRITLPEPAAEVLVLVHADRAVILRGFRNGQVVASKESPNPGDLGLVLTADGIEYVELVLSGSPRGKMWLLRVCFIPQLDRDREYEVDRVRSQLKKETSAETARWCGDGHLLEPDSVYQLKIKTQLRKWHDGTEDTPQEKDEYVYFRTAGPPGFFAPDSALRDLTRYVNSQTSIPANGQHPVYRGYDLRVVFNENYVQRMYDGTSHLLGVILLDRNGQPARDELGQVVSVSTEWLRDPHSAPNSADRLWRWALERPELAEAGCEPADDIGACLEPNNSLEARLQERPLMPQALIEARVIAAGRDEPVYRLSFTTSRFVTFSHHVHSFQDFAWGHHRLSGGPGAPLLSEDELAQLNQLVLDKRAKGPAFDADEAIAFERIMGSLFKLDDRPRPDRLEILLLRDEARSYALLLESPEPIDWTRTSLVVRHVAHVHAAGLPATGSVKIIDAAFRPSEADEQPDYKAEWVEVLLQSDTNPSGFRIEHANNSSAEEAVQFTTYYQFGEEQWMPAGTVIRIHSGSEATGAGEATERLHRYVTPPNGNGAWLLNNTGDTLRLMDGAGQAVHRRFFLPSSALGDLDVVLIRNADSTRAFIFFSESEGIAAGDIPAGRFRLEWRFVRDLGGNAPVLKRWGSALAEEAAIEFDLPAQRP